MIHTSKSTMSQRNSKGRVLKIKQVIDSEELKTNNKLHQSICFH